MVIAVLCFSFSLCNASSETLFHTPNLFFLSQINNDGVAVALPDPGIDKLYCRTLPNRSYALVSSISFNGVLVSPKRRYFIPSLQCSAIIREIHTFGQLVPLLKKRKAPQHRGFGEKLVKEAEKIVYTEFGRSAKKDYGISKIAVISGIGAREYWRKLGYKLKNSYMVKKLTTNN